MGGAYVAKPEAAVAADLPPGWNPIWPFTGVSPPGYDPVLALSISAPALIAPASALGETTIGLSDHATYPTTEPSEQITIRAEWADGGELRLKFSGGTAFLASVSQSYADIGDGFWGAEPTLVFDTSVADNGKSFFVIVTSSPLGGTGLSTQTEVTVTVSVTKKVIWTVTWSGTLGASGYLGWNQNAVQMDSLASPYDYSALPNPGTYYGQAYVDLIDGSDDEYDSISSGELAVSFPTTKSSMIVIDPMTEEKFYALWIYFASYIEPGGGGTLTLKADFYNASNDVIDTATKVLSIDDSWPRGENYSGWVRVDVDGNTLDEQWDY